MPQPSMPTDRTSTPVPRRGFLRDTCLLGAMMAVGAPLAAALSACDGGSPDDGPPGDGVTVSGNTITLDLTRPGASALAAAGGFLYVASAETVAVNVDGTTVRAFSSVCPHAGNP